MPCKRKRLVRLKQSGYLVRVGCGKCPACLMNKRMEVAIRLNYDLLSPRCYDSIFLTLDYDDDHLEYNVVDKNTGEVYPLASVNPETLQDYWKRVRFNLDYDANRTQLYYYASGEYGDITKRPHYHAVVYLLGEPTNKISLADALQMSWTFCQWNPVKIAKCIQKPKTKGALLYSAKHNVKRCQGIEGQYPYFQRMSKGYGSEFFTQYPSEVEFLKRNMYLYLDNIYKVAAPRYYLDKLDLKRPEEEVINFNRQQEEQDTIKLHQFINAHRIRDPSHSDDYYAHEYQLKQKHQIIYDQKYFDLMYNKLSKSLKI